jgi:hypothetical protein
MVYDIDPELATKEKELFLTECFSNHSIIIFQHSLYIESCTLKKLNNKIVMDKAQ